MTEETEETEELELYFRGDRCGDSYRIKLETIGSRRHWVCYFNDRQDGGWNQINRWPGEDRRNQAIRVCNDHARSMRLIKFLPTRKKPDGAAFIAGAIAQAACLGL